MAIARAPKQWMLTKNETINTFENWRQNLLYILSLDQNFAPFLGEDVTWLKKSAANPTRGLVNDVDPVPAAQRLTAQQKNIHLELLLGQIANFCPVISRNSVVKGSTSLGDIWQKIRQHFGFQSTGAHFLDLSNIVLQPDERPEDLYQRLTAFFEDNLLTVGGGVTHHGEPVLADEDLTPTLENTIVHIWLQLLNPGLPQLIKQRYGAELRNRSLASLKPEISQALSSLLDELRSMEDTKAMRIGGAGGRKFNTSRRKPFLSCVLCKTAGRPYNTHNLVDCRFLPDGDRRSLGRSRRVNEECSSSEDDDQAALVEHVAHVRIDTIPTSTRRVNIVQSPTMNTYYDSRPLKLTLDTGATTNMIRASTAKEFNMPITPASQMARQADGVTPLDVTGEVHCRLTRGASSFRLNALVVRQLDVDVLAGNPFMVSNDIAVRPAKQQITIADAETVHYGVHTSSKRTSSARRAQAYLLRSSHRTVVLPGDYLQLNTPGETAPDILWAIEP